MSEFPKTRRNQVRRLPKRGEYQKDAIYKIIDQALICHVGFVQEGQPFVIPTIHARAGDTIYLHGSGQSRMLKHIQEGNPLCIEITLLDGIVFARSVFHSSLNYRSVVLFGIGRLVDSDDEKLRALETMIKHVAPGRWEQARKPNRSELAQTTVVAIQIESGSAKVRTGPPSDDEEDYQLPVWAGVLPLQLQALEPVADPRLPADVSTPEYIVHYLDTFQLDGRKNNEDHGV
jgi:nitroimidazol reductase NimA-like FMN-containing flavoprotein (pyridoxamine 5'-phosphate oxidase superfamily)